MSYFPDGVVYIIVPTADLTTEMENNMKKSFSSCFDAARVSTDTPEKTLLKVKEPISAVFNGYTWYNHEDILVEMEKAAWT